MSEPIGNTKQLPIAYCEDLDSFGMNVASQLLGLDSTDEEFLETPLYAHPQKELSDEEIVTNAKIKQMMQEEIDELRKKLQRLSDIEQEPVLWVHIKTLDRTIRQGTSGAFWHKFPDGYGLSKEEFIPLYTQPLKKAREK